MKNKAIEVEEEFFEKQGEGEVNSVNQADWCSWSFSVTGVLGSQS